MFSQLVNVDLVKNLSFSAFKKHSEHFGGGVYRMFDKNKKIIYVGKSNDLQRRITTHLGGKTNTDYFIKKVKHIDYHKNDSPIMQTMLEGILIAYYKPKYNDEVKDEEAMKKKKAKK
jgi:excinuclease UvrABC nuclease subunit